MTNERESDSATPDAPGSFGLFGGFTQPTTTDFSSFGSYRNTPSEGNSSDDGNHSKKRKTTSSSDNLPRVYNSKCYMHDLCHITIEQMNFNKDGIMASYSFKMNYNFKPAYFNPSRNIKITINYKQKECGEKYQSISFDDFKKFTNTLDEDNACEMNFIDEIIKYDNHSKVLYHTIGTEYDNDNIIQFKINLDEECRDNIIGVFDEIIDKIDRYMAV